jgi:pyridoxine kinase
MKSIFSIQSHVAYGYVGNRAAIFPLQRLGYEVSFINTVQFSNHTGYGTWTGEIFSAQHIQNVLDGLWQNGALSNISAMLSGYQGSAELGEIIVKTVQRLKQEHPTVVYCCDPVIGDIDRGVYVKPGVAKFIKESVIQHADILTPNQFELAYLTDKPHLDTLEEVLTSCQILHSRGPKIILVTSLTRVDVSPDFIEMLVSTPQGAWITRTPRLYFNKAPVGSGDVTAAIFLAHYLQHRNPVEALEQVTAAVYALFKTTHDAGTYELQLIAAQDDMVDPDELFSAEHVILEDDET